ncbi:MAG: glycosyltransferase [Alphaproteobacteria bacterium]|nr:glycosyltransferase [Alphaproteobacteria bacterium]
MAQKLAWTLACKPHAARFLAALQLVLYHRAYGRAKQSRQHGLPGELIISLTSFPRRFPTLQYTLQSLRDQTIRADKIILWLAEQDVPLLPEAVRKMGVRIEAVPDVRSFKKLVFAIERYPEAFIATADDDVFYKPDWLEDLVEGFDPADPSIVCHRAHRLPAGIGSSIAEYREWEWDVQDEKARQPSPDLMPTGLGGVLYFPGCLHRDVTNIQAFTELCPDADDLWFVWQAHRAGSRYKKVGKAFPLLYWAGTQTECLFNSNADENNVQLRRLWDTYGW